MIILPVGYYIDKGNGSIEIKILLMSKANFGENQEDAMWESVSFNKPVDPQVLIEAINKIDRSDRTV